MADPGEADVSAVADHVEHIAAVAGKKQYVTIQSLATSQLKTDVLSPASVSAAILTV